VLSEAMTGAGPMPRSGETGVLAALGKFPTVVKLTDVTVEPALSGLPGRGGGFGSGFGPATAMSLPIIMPEVNVMDQFTSSWKGGVLPSLRKSVISSVQVPFKAFAFWPMRDWNPAGSSGRKVCSNGALAPWGPSWILRAAVSSNTVPTTATMTGGFPAVVT